MSENDETRLNILEKARQLFLTNGFSSVTTDDIANSIGVSKKTLYKYFNTKEDLLEESVFSMIQVMGGRLENAVKDSKLAFPEKLVFIRSMLVRTVTSLRPSFINDVKRNAPGFWVKIEKFRREKIWANFTGLIIQGKEQGYLRADCNEKIFTALFLSLVEGTINPAALSESEFTAPQLLDAIFSLVFQGAFTEKGRKAVDLSTIPEGV